MRNFGRQFRQYFYRAQRATVQTQLFKPTQFSLKDGTTGFGKFQQAVKSSPTPRQGK